LFFDFEIVFQNRKDQTCGIEENPKAIAVFAAFSTPPDNIASAFRW
jgi:hypothetical protein